MTASQQLQKFASTFTIFFPLWTVIAAGAALARPETYTFMSTDKFTGALAILYELVSAFLTHSLTHAIWYLMLHLLCQDALHGHHAQR
jgi:hypothetical protein